MPPKRLKNSVKQQQINVTGIDKPAIPSICPVCEEGIIDATASRSGQDSIFCEGLCSYGSIGSVLDYQNKRFWKCHNRV